MPPSWRAANVQTRYLRFVVLKRTKDNIVEGTRKKKKRRKGGTRHQSRIAEPQCTDPWSSMQREEGTRSHYRCCEHHESEDGEMHPEKGNICRDAGKNKNKSFVVDLLFDEQDDAKNLSGWKVIEGIE